MARLDDDQIAAGLDELDGWERDGDAITKTFKLDDFVGSVGFVDKLVEPAEDMGHHPDVSISWNEVRVTITTHDADATRVPGAAVRAAYTFEDVHFDRDRHDLRAEDIDLLRSVVAALKADPILAVNIEGYTCNLGTPAHNLALGVSRATAVRDYLVSQGIAAERLHTASRGEDQPKHDNSREETRRLNRRVAFVPESKQ